MKTLLRSASVLALFAAALCAHGAVIDFENLPNPINGALYNFQSNPLTSGGFLFSTNGPAGFGTIEPNPVYNYTGSVALSSLDTGSTVTLAPIAGGVFTLASLQVANFFADGRTSTITFTGTKAAGGTVTATYALTKSLALQNVVLSGFTNLSSVAFAGDQTQVDNLVVTVNPTPEPSALGALGLGAVAMLRRRKRA